MKHFNNRYSDDTLNENFATNNVDPCDVYEDEDCTVVTDDSTFRPVFLPREEKNAFDIIYCVLFSLVLFAGLGLVLYCIGALCYGFAGLIGKLIAMIL